MPMHLDEALTDADFAEFEDALRQWSTQEVEECLAYCERILLEGAMFRDECPSCIHQAENGQRAVELAQAELDRRQQ